MRQTLRTGGLVVTAGLLLAVWHGPARAAADEVSVGGYQDEALAAAHRDLVGSLATEGQYTIRLGSGESSALTAFTPRFGSLGPSGVGRLPEYAARNSAPEPPPSEEMHSLLLGLSGTEIAGWAVDLAATAGVVNPEATAGTGESGLVVGGELAVSGLRFDAAYGQDASLMGLGLDGSRMTAGVTYGLGPIDTRLSYSVVDRQETTADTSVFTVGSRLNLTSGLAVQGDVAYAGDRNGDAATAGRVSLKLNF
jgi:hypothetical protein